MDKFEKNVKVALYFIISANFIMAIGMVIFGYATGSTLPFYGAIFIILAAIALIFIMKNAVKKYKSMLENENDKNSLK